MMQFFDRNLVLGVAVIFAALLIAIGFNLSQSSISGIQEAMVKDNQNTELALPSYLEKVGSASNVENEGVISFAENDENPRLISVSGSVTKAVAPDKAEITLAVETTNKSAKVSQQENAELSNKVRAALAGIGIQEDSIETVSFNLYEETRWNDTLRRSETVGFKTSNMIRVTLNDLEMAGEVIDVAVAAGVNRVSSVNFSLSKEKMEELRVEALETASENARLKAESIASGLGVSIGKVYSASENSNFATPYYYRAMVDYAGSESVDTPITPGDVEFSATVSVSFEMN